MSIKKLKCVFMGTPEFAKKHLEDLISNFEFFDILSVYTQPDRPKGRSKNPSHSPVKEFAIEKNLPVIQVENFKNKKTLSQLRLFDPDIIIIVAYGLILPKEVLEIPKYGAINIHASLLPKYRGASPIQHTLLNGDTIGGVTSFILNSQIDAGSILIQKEIAITFEDDYDSLSEKLCLLGRQCLLETLHRMQNTNFSFKGIPQKKDSESNTKKISKEMSILNINKSAFTLHNQVRALNNWPVCKIQIPLKNKTIKVKLYKTYPIPICKYCHKKNTGSLSSLEDKELHLKTAKGCLSILELQPESKKRMSIESFLNGYQIGEGIVIV